MQQGNTINVQHSPTYLIVAIKNLYYYYYYMIWMSLVTGLFFLLLLLNQRWSPPLRLQASHCSIFRIMCDVPSIAVFCSEYIEYFPGTVSKYFLKLLVTIPVAPIITGTIVHFMFHIRCISIHKLLYFNFFSASFCTTFLLLLLLNGATDRFGPWPLVQPPSRNSCLLLVSVLLHSAATRIPS